jgi:hypothetical protein
MIISCYCNVSSGLKFHYNIDGNQGFDYDMVFHLNTWTGLIIYVKEKKKNKGIQSKL